MRPKSGSAWLVVTTALIALSGVGLFVAGLFLPDAPGTTQISVQGILHTIAFTLVFLPLGLACLFVGVKFVSIAGWRIHCVYFLLSCLFPVFSSLSSLSSTFSIHTC